MVAPRAGALLVLGPSLVGTLVLLAECWVAVEALGRLFDRTDVASIDAVE
jgi:hypothetical protein